MGLRRLPEVAGAAKKLSTKKRKAVTVKSKRGRGRPAGDRPWEALGISRDAYYKRRQRARQAARSAGRKRK